MNGIAIRHDATGHRFETEVEGHVGYVEYEREAGVMAITHTIVPPEIGNRGIAGQLVQAALEYARSQGLKVSPRCSYAEVWMRRHPQYDDLRV